MQEDSALGDIDVSFAMTDGTGGFATHLDLSGTRSQPWLYWFNGDPDTCDLYRFDRTT
jgi:hypothetical protein